MPVQTAKRYRYQTCSVAHLGVERTEKTETKQMLNKRDCKYYNPIVRSVNDLNLIHESRLMRNIGKSFDSIEATEKLFVRGL